MTKIDLVKELLSNHSDEEIITYLETVMSGVVRDYQVSLEKGDSNILWGNLGDLKQVSTILRLLKKRNAERSAPKSST